MSFWLNKSISWRLTFLLTNVTINYNFIMEGMIYCNQNCLMNFIYSFYRESIHRLLIENIERVFKNYLSS